MSLLTTWSNYNKHTDRGLQIKYVAEYQTDGMFAGYWKYTRYATKEYSYGGMTKDAASSCAKAKEIQYDYNRRYWYLDRGQLRSRIFRDRKTTVVPKHDGGAMWSVHISVNEEDEAYSVEYTDTPAGLFDMTRDYDDDNIELKYGSLVKVWFGTDGYLRLKVVYGYGGEVVHDTLQRGLVVQASYRADATVWAAPDNGVGGVVEDVVEHEYVQYKFHWVNTAVYGVPLWWRVKFVGSGSEADAYTNYLPTPGGYADTHANTITATRCWLDSTTGTWQIMYTGDMNGWWTVPKTIEWSADGSTWGVCDFADGWYDTGITAADAASMIDPAVGMLYFRVKANGVTSNAVHTPYDPSLYEGTDDLFAQYAYATGGSLEIKPKGTFTGYDIASAQILKYDDAQGAWIDTEATSDGTTLTVANAARAWYRIAQGEHSSDPFRFPLQTDAECCIESFRVIATGGQYDKEVGITFALASDLVYDDARIYKKQGSSAWVEAMRIASGEGGLVRSDMIDPATACKLKVREKNGLWESAEISWPLQGTL